MTTNLNTGRARSDVSKEGHWYRYPLIALIIVSTIPSLYSFVVIILYKLFDIRIGPLAGTAFNNNFKLPTVWDLLGMPFLLAAGNWFYLVVYYISYSKGSKSDENKTLYKIAMWFSIVLMSFTNLIFVIGTPEELFSKSTDAGQGTGVIIAFFIALQPIVGVVGWLLGAVLVAVLPNRHAPKAPGPKSE